MYCTVRWHPSSLAESIGKSCILDNKLDLEILMAQVFRIFPCILNEIFIGVRLGIVFQIREGNTDNLGVFFLIFP